MGTYKTKQNETKMTTYKNRHNGDMQDETYDDIQDKTPLRHGRQDKNDDIKDEA